MAQTTERARAIPRRGDASPHARKADCTGDIDSSQYSDVGTAYGLAKLTECELPLRALRLTNRFRARAAAAEVVQRFDQYGELDDDAIVSTPSMRGSA